MRYSSNPQWLRGWWMVQTVPSTADIWYYYFQTAAFVGYQMTKPKNIHLPPQRKPTNEGSVTNYYASEIAESRYAETNDVANDFRIDWNPFGGGETVELFKRFMNLNDTMFGISRSGERLVASKLKF